MNILRSLLAKITQPIRTILSSPLKLVSAPRLLLGLSLPTRIALVTFLVVIILVITIVYYKGQDVTNITRDDLPFWIVIGVLAIAIPLVVRYVVRLWLEGPPSLFPKIDEAWEKGLAALEEQGIDPMDVPIFLISGVENAAVTKQIFDGVLDRFVVAGVPDPGAPLHWYASSDAIYLVLTRVTNIGQLERKKGQVAAGIGTSDRSMKDLLSQTLMIMESQDLTTAKTMTGTQAGPEASLKEQKISPAALGQTVMPGSFDSSDSVSSTAAAPRGGGVKLSNAELQQTAAELTHVCRLLKKLREPAAPINGLVSLVSLDLVLGKRVDRIEIQQAMKEDLETLRRGLRLRFPAVTLVVGMESEIGFRELMRRIGVETAKAARFGKGMPHLGIPPLPEHVESIAAHACAAFEIYAYHLFKEKDGLTKIGNPKLYALICRVRTELRDALEHILTHAYGRRDDTRELPASDALFYGGCYFAATGSRDDLQGFVNGVITRLKETEDSLDWTDDARREEQRYQTLAHLGLLVDGILVVVLCFLLLNALRS